MGQIHLKIMKRISLNLILCLFFKVLWEKIGQPEKHPFPSGIYFTAVEKTSCSANLFVFVLKIICLDEDEFLTHSLLRD